MKKWQWRVTQSIKNQVPYIYIYIYIYTLVVEMKIGWQCETPTWRFNPLISHFTGVKIWALCDVTPCRPSDSYGQAFWPIMKARSSFQTPVSVYRTLSQHPQRLESSATPLHEPHISHFTAISKSNTSYWVTSIIFNTVSMTGIY